VDGSAIPLGSLVFARAWASSSPDRGFVAPKGESTTRGKVRINHLDVMLARVNPSDHFAVNAPLIVESLCELIFQPLERRATSAIFFLL
jgi:hypothetical protein